MNSALPREIESVGTNSDALTRTAPLVSDDSSSSAFETNPTEQSDEQQPTDQVSETTASPTQLKSRRKPKKSTSRSRASSSPVQGKPQAASLAVTQGGTSDSAVPKTDSKTTTDKGTKYSSSAQRLEREAQMHFMTLSSHIKKGKGHYFRDENGNLYLMDGGRRIPLNYDRDNHALNHLLLKVCSITVQSQVAKPTIARLIDAAYSSAQRFKLYRFSALSEDQTRLYVPVAGPSLLEISATGIHTHIKSGENRDSIIVEPADGQRLFTFSKDADVKAGLTHFEELLVNAQAVRKPAMAWLLAMQEVLFPFIRSAYQGRFITFHKGLSGSGKSSGARWFAALFGWDELKGNFSPAALIGEGDIGICFLDNKEEADLKREFENYLLFASTGGESGRGTTSGGVRKANRSRPIVAFTAIEGPSLPELRNRCITVEYSLTEQQKSEFAGASTHLRLIKTSRDQILSALMHVLKRFMELNDEPGDLESVPAGAARFQENYRAVCKLIRMFAELAEKENGWAQAIIDQWSESLRDADSRNERLDHLIRAFIDEKTPQAMGEQSEELFATAPAAKRVKLSVPDLRMVSITYLGRQGTLYVTHYAAIFDWLKHKNGHDAQLPQTPHALASRLREISSESMLVLREQDVDEEEDKQLYELIKHTDTTRFVGFFVPG